MRKIFKILGISVGCLVALGFILWAGYYGYGHYRAYKIMHDLKEPYIKDAKQSLGGESPMDVYSKFRKALKDGDTDMALKYIFVSSRDKYAKELKDQERIKIYLDMPEELKEDRISKCSGEAFACEATAVYYYEYEVAEVEEHEFEGIKFTIDPGKYSHRINFIRNLSGKWQIDEL